MFPRALLLSLSFLFGTAIVPLLRPVNLQAQSHRPAVLPETLQRQIISTMQRDLGGSADAFKITQTEVSTWQDCLTRPALTRSAFNCQFSGRKTGYQVQVQGQGENWTYYVVDSMDNRSPQITLDGPASVSPKVRQALLKSLGYDPKTDLKILAARTMGLLPACDRSSVSKPCNATPTPYWQLLIEQHPRPIAIDLQGRIMPPQPGRLKSFLPKNLAGLSPVFAEAVLNDVRDRHLGTLPPNLRVERIQRSTWTMCNSGGVPVSGPGPSRPIVGACAVGVTSGWQMISRSGPVQWVHYVQPWPLTARVNPLSAPLAPDGPQSLPKTTADAVIQAVAQQEKKARSNYKIHWADSRFFDACLNPAPQFNPVNAALSCRQGLQSGWQVQVMGQGKPGTPRLYNYHANLTGTDLRFISAHDWMPPPSAAPIGR
jgi:hypothetical protein